MQLAENQPKRTSSVHVKDLVKDYPAFGEPLHVLRGVNLEIQGGHNLAVLGPSGSGKSTLLQILGTLDSPTSGNVAIDGENPFALEARELAEFRNQRVGFVFQDHQLLPQLTVLENVLLPTLACGGLRQGEMEYAQSLVDRVGLSHRTAHKPGELSGGERQRAALARALVRKPSLILADEPTGNLDRKNAMEAAGLLLELPKLMGAILIVVTHSADLAAQCERRMEISDGRLLEHE